MKRNEIAHLVSTQVINALGIVNTIRKWIDPISQQATVIPDWGNRDLKLGTIRAAVRQLGIDWQRFLDA